MDTSDGEIFAMSEDVPFSERVRLFRIRPLLLLGGALQW